MQHFYNNDISSLCCQPRDIKKRISELTDENIADIKKLPSIAKYLSSRLANKDDELDDDEFKVHITYKNLKTRILKIIHVAGKYLSNISSFFYQHTYSYRRIINA